MAGRKTRISLTTGFMCAALLLSSCSVDPQKAKVSYFRAGQSYMKKGQYGDATVEFRNALRMDPRFVDAYYQLSQANLARRDWNAAYDALQKAIDLDPSRLDARLDLGRLYLASRSFVEAEDEANSIIKQNSRDVGAYQLLGAALIGEQKPDQALLAFAKVTELRPNDPTAYVNLALVEISLRHPSEAEKHLKLAIRVDPKSVLGIIDLANFYRLQNRVPAALQVLQDAVVKNPEEVSVYIDWASTLASEGRKSDAEAVLDRLRKQLPSSAAAAVAIGDLYFRRQETDKALTEYRRGLTVAPNDFETKKRLQDLYLSTNQTQLASDFDRELMKEAPKDVIIRVDHGRLLMAQGKFNEAIIFLQKVVADAVDSPEAHYYLAMALWQNGDLGQAHGALLDALKASENLPIALQALARLSLAQGNSSGAEIYASELVQAHPADPAYRQLLAETLAQQGKTQTAEQQILIAVRLLPNDSDIRLSSAKIYSAEKRWTEAQKEFETCLRLDPHNVTALSQFADFLMAQNQLPQAFDRVREYVNDNPNDANGHVILGALNFQEKNYSSARTEFERAIQINPNNVQAYLRLGKVFETQGQTDLALSRYEKALDQQPQLAPLAAMVGNLYVNKGDLETARKYYAQALSADPNFAIANANMAWIDAEQGKNLDIALGLAQKAKSLMPELLSITDTLGWVMFKRGNYGAAIPLLNECIRKSPESAEFRYHLGMTLVANGQKEKGRDQLQEALRLKLRDTEAKQVRGVLAQFN
jgi:tetratricopeptide (TPR) repeat protein